MTLIVEQSARFRMHRSRSKSRPSPTARYDPPMRVVATFLIAVQLLLAAHALWHHHDDDDHSTGGGGDTCQYCRVLHQPLLAPPPEPLILPSAAAPCLDREAPESAPQAGPHDPASIRGPPDLLAA